MTGNVDDHLLLRQCGVQIWNNPHLPRVAESKRFRRRSILEARVEGALVLGDEAAARALRPPRRDRDATAGEGVLAELGAQLPRPPSTNGRSRSIGAGKTIVVAFVDPISSSVWR